MKLRMLWLCSTLAALIWCGSRAEAALLVVENGVPDVLSFTPAGAQSTFATTNLDSPIGINVDAARNVYVVDQGFNPPPSTFHDSVAKFSPGGTPLGFFVTPATPPGNTLNAPFDIAFDGSGNAYVTSGANDVNYPNVTGYIAKYDPAGNSLTILGSPGSANSAPPNATASDTNVPTGIGYNPLNNLIYVVNSAATGKNANSILTYSPASTNTSAPLNVYTFTGAGVDALSNAQQLAIAGPGSAAAELGHIFIASNGNNKIQEYDANGNYVRTIDTRAGGNPEGVAYDPTTNTLYASFLGAGEGSGFIEKYVFNGTSFDAGTLFASNLSDPVYLAIQPVPEPGSVVLMGLGLGALAGRRIRRRLVEAGRTA